MGCANPQPVGPIALKQMRPCGVCIECRLAYSRSKAVRCVHEMQYWDAASFLTLTYDDDHLPYNEGAVLPTLVKPDLQKFFKRLRKKLGKKISYMASGEYGEQRGRPHYHVILFGEDFSADRRTSKMNKDYFESEDLDKLWQYQGSCVIGDVTFDSANYVAGYTVKKLVGKKARKEYDDLGRERPFGCQSTKPAIGRRWLEDHFQEIVDHDSVIVNGAHHLPPRYYDDWFKKWCPDTYKKMKEKRSADALYRIENNVVASNTEKAIVKQNRISKKTSKL